LINSYSVFKEISLENFKKKLNSHKIEDCIKDFKRRVGNGEWLNMDLENIMKLYYIFINEYKQNMKDFR
jgi:hypothetical protein